MRDLSRPIRAIADHRRAKDVGKMGVGSLFARKRREQAEVSSQYSGGVRSWNGKEECTGVLNIDLTDGGNWGPETQPIGYASIQERWRGPQVDGGHPEPCRRAQQIGRQDEMRRAVQVARFVVLPQGTVRIDGELTRTRKAATTGSSRKNIMNIITRSTRIGAA